MHHWRQAAVYQPISSEIILLSNFTGKGPAAPGTFRGASFFGNYDLAGNVKEWCWNESGDKRYILGGAWSEPSYMFIDNDARSPFERAEAFGFRCARYIRPVPESVKAPLNMKRRDFAYHGISLGAISALPCLAIEARFQTAILQGGGLSGRQAPPEGDPFHFAPRIRIPVLMINGRNDFEYPVERLQVPLFRLLGSPPADKRHFVVEGGHVVPRNLVVKETLDWLDRYLGFVSVPH